MELKKIVLLPIPTGWRDSNSPMGDGLSTINGVLQSLSLIWAVTSTVLGALTKFDVFWTFYVFEVKKIVYYSLQWAGGTPTVPWAIPYQPSMVCHKYSRSEMHLLNETRFHAYWKKNLSSARRREDQMMTNFVKHLWWLIGHYPWDCWSPSSPLEWVVKRFFSTTWQNKIEKRRKFKSYFTY